MEAQGADFAYTHALTLLQRAVGALDKILRPHGELSPGELCNAVFALRMLTPRTTDMRLYLDWVSAKARQQIVEGVQMLIASV